MPARFAAAMAALAAPWPGAVAVSGGGDSVALMLLLAQWAKGGSRPAPMVLTVDHGLRKDSAKEAELVRKLAREVGLKAEVLVWKGPKPEADIEAEARGARYRLMGAWCAGNRIDALYVAHTLEDQAETFLLRLARGSGLDGLAAMRPLATLPLAGFESVRLIRPLLEFRKEDLRAFLKSRGVAWSDDPMNSDPRFARSRLRAAWPQVEALGLSASRLADAARHLARARQALDEMMENFLRRGARFDAEGAQLDGLRLKMLPREVGLRALAAVLSRVSGESYRPRFDSLERLFDAILGDKLGGGATLHGVAVASAPIRGQAFGSATLTFVREQGRAQEEPKPPKTRKK